MIQDARSAAFTALVKMQKNGGFSNLTLGSTLASAQLNVREASLASAMFYGTVERLYTLDFINRRYVGRRMDKLPYAVQSALRLGTYQLLYMDKIPPHAAAGETVGLVKKSDPWAAGLVNAVLKKVCADKSECLSAAESSDDPSVKYSCEKWVYDLLARDYGAETADKILASSFDKRPLTVRVNTLKNSRDELMNILMQEKCTAYALYDGLDALSFSDAGSVEHMPSFMEGRFHVQDAASQLCCAALNVKKGMRVLDICAAPGGKSFTAAEMAGNTGEVVSQDLYESRIRLIESGARRLGIDSIKTVCGDASQYNEKLGIFDRVLCDVPCSGLGVISKKPDIKYKSRDDISRLPELQLSILTAAQRYLKPGGILIYSTCTLNKDENEGIVNKFLKSDSLLPINIPAVYDIINCEGSAAPMITLLPHVNFTDGFFIAAFTKPA